MRRSAKPAKARVEAKPSVARKARKKDGSKVRDPEKRLAEALEQQAATAEILRVIGRSQADLQLVFDTIAQSAVRLCGGVQGNVVRFDGELVHRVAGFNLDPEGEEAFRHYFPRALSRDLAITRAILDGSVVHIADWLQDTHYLRELAQATRARAVLAIPMLRDGQPIGAISVVRREPQPFSDSQIALLQTFADQAVLAIENVRLFTELQHKNGALTEALEQQTATSEILRVIARSPTDLQPVLNDLVGNAGRLCQSAETALLLVEGEQLRVVATSGYAAGEASGLSHPIHRGWVAGRAVVDATTVHVEDLANAEGEFPLGQEIAIRFGHRTALATPLLRDGTPIGALFLRRRQVRQFSDKEIALLQTFADQAVIAIENVRLFTELQASNRDLTTALDKQTATSDILAVISRSQTDVQPVFDAILASAVHLLGAHQGALTRVVSDQIELAASTLPGSEEPALRAAAVEGSHAQVVRERAPVNIADMQTDPRVSEGRRALARAHGYRSLVAVPLLRQDEALGAIAVTRPDPGGFAADEIALLRTFADQAVIAIENVRLFTELQTSNRELTTALDKQTATSDILRVISRSQMDVQPVFDAILDSAVRLLGAYSGALTRIAGDQIELAALKGHDAGAAAARATFPQLLQSERPIAQAIRDRAPLNIADAQTDPRVPEVGRANARARGFRSWVAVPLLRQDEALGAIAVNRREPGGFTDDEIGLLQTFADQAVIAIENARLLSELQARTKELTHSVEQLTALAEVGQAISSTLDLQTVLSTIAARATQLSGTDAGVIYEYDESREVFVPRATEHLEAEIVETMRATPVRKGEGATGRLAEAQEPIQVPDILDTPTTESRVRGALVRAGYRALLAVPLVREDHLFGGLTVIRKAPGAFAPDAIELLQTFATQSSLAIQNARLFLEIEDKSRQLEAASQHKSEFLANMSHELRTPLNAIIGFSEVLSERMFGALNEKQEEYLKDIHASGQHLLSLINDILDLSKIEAGRMELELTDFDLPTAIDNALTLVRERASRRGIALHPAADGNLGQIRGDERKIKQVLLNLLSNAIKFTPEGGRIDVRAIAVGGSAEVSVTDTGAGIAPKDHEAIFEEFRQVGTAAKKVEGTGLGLALSRKFVELHGGRIWVQSQEGLGSTFTFTIPVRRGEEAHRR